ncbi:MAG: sulfatase-like hydrolase/transferase [Bacteroidota bacterium]
MKNLLARFPHPVTIFVFTILSLFALPYSGCQPSTTTTEPITPSSKKEHTNVVLILIDDLSHLGVSAYGADQLSNDFDLFKNVQFSTPNIDRLAKEGTVCAQSYVYPICENSRIALMSGKTNQRNLLKVKSQHASEITFGDVFQRAGYATGIFGKWKQTRGTKEIPGKDYIFEFGWDEFACFDVVGEGQRFINPNLVINGEVKDYKGRTDLDPATGRRWYGPDICNRYALDFIERHQDEPFFLYYPMLLVHDDHKPTPDTKPNSLFDNFDEANHNRNGHTGDDPKYLPDMIAYMDKLIGKVTDKLDKLQLREQTLVIVMGDNGTKEIFTHVYSDGNEFPGRKGGTTENGIHVPMVFSQPGTIPVSSKDAYREYIGLVDVTDIYPTICDAADIQIPHSSDLDGISFWSQIKGGSGQPRQHIYSWFNGNDPVEKTDLLLTYAFNEDFKYYAPTDEYPEGRFFDLRTDSLELGGATFSERKWGVRLYSGLDLNQLTDEQQTAYEYLKGVTKQNQFKAVEELVILAPKTSLTVGQELQLDYAITPKNATRNNVIWASSDPAIATVDKFGTVTTKSPGQVAITLYSWDDAHPLSANRPVTYRTDGVQDVLQLTVE